VVYKAKVIHTIRRLMQRAMSLKYSIRLRNTKLALLQLNFLRKPNCLSFTFVTFKQENGFKGTVFPRIEAPASISTTTSDPQPVFKARLVLEHAHYDELTVTCISQKQ